MDNDTPRLRIAGHNAETVREALIAKLVPPVVILRPFLVETKTEAADMVETASAHDSPDFAADKILDALADREWIQFCDRGLTQAEERALRDRLIDLGYIE